MANFYKLTEKANYSRNKTSRMPSIPWKYICIYLLWRVYGPEITTEKYHYYTALLSQEYCKDHEDKAQCVVEQVRTLLALTNDTYYSLFANLTTIIEESGIKEAFKDFRNYFKTGPNLPGIFIHPPSERKQKDNVSTSMSTMLNKMQEEYQNTLPGDLANQVMQRLETIAFDHEKTDAFCTMKFGINPKDTFDLINDVAKLTNMPRDLQSTLEKTVKVIDADSSIAQSTPFKIDGKVHYILIAAYRNGKIAKDYVKYSLKRPNKTRRFSMIYNSPSSYMARIFEWIVQCFYF